MSSTSAFDPAPVPSHTTNETTGIEMCYYHIFGTNTMGGAEDSGERQIGCTSTIDFETMWTKDGTYKVEIWAKDNANNITDKKTYGPYNIDTVKPICLVKEIRLHGGQSDNQYFHNGNIYYRGVAGAGEYSVTVDSKDTTGVTCSNAGTCVSTLKTVEFETTIGAGRTAILPTPTPTKTETHQYVWSGNSSYALDIFRPDSASRCTDVAGNFSPFTADVNTRVIVEDAGDLALPVTQFTFAPDNSVPSVSRGNITFASGNDGNGGPEALYSGSNLKYFAASASRKIALTNLSDTGAGLRPFQVRIENANNKDTKTPYLFTGSTATVQVLGPSTVEMDHNFRAAGVTPS